MSVCRPNEELPVEIEQAAAAFKQGDISLATAHLLRHFAKSERLRVPPHPSAMFQGVICLFADVPDGSEHTPTTFIADLGECPNLAGLLATYVGRRGKLHPSADPANIALPLFRAVENKSMDLLEIYQAAQAKAYSDWVAPTLKLSDIVATAIVTETAQRNHEPLEVITQTELNERIRRSVQQLDAVNIHEGKVIETVAKPYIEPQTAANTSQPTPASRR